MLTAISPIPAAYLTACDRPGRVETLKIPGFSDALVYLPFGYDEGDARFDVFYLLHGGGGDPSAFFAEDHLFQNQLDNMIARGDMKPMIVVAPTYYAPGCRDKGVAASGVAVKAFAPVLRARIVPAVDAAFRTLPAREHRAIGGFSMGSVATWYAFLEALDLFRWFMPLSGDCWICGEKGGSTYADETARQLAQAGKGWDFFIHALTGDQDIAYPNLDPQMKAMAACAETFGENLRYSVLEGGVHAYPDIRRYIYHALPEFFR